MSPIHSETNEAWRACYSCLINLFMRSCSSLLYSTILIVSVGTACSEVLIDIEWLLSWSEEFTESDFSSSYAASKNSLMSKSGFDSFMIEIIRLRILSSPSVEGRFKFN